MAEDKRVNINEVQKPLSNQLDLKKFLKKYMAKLAEIRSLVLPHRHVTKETEASAVGTKASVVAPKRTFWTSLNVKSKVALILSGSVVFSVLAVGGIELTCNPWFCTSCHEMKSIGENWKFSKHGPNNPGNPVMTNCLGCHAQPGALGFLKAKINGLFSLAYHIGGDYHVEATQPVVCMRAGCHKIEDLDRAYRPNRTVTLNHGQHIKVMKEIGTRYQCMPCHRNIGHGAEKYLPDMKAECLTICHTDRDIKITNCALCHQHHPEITLKGEKVAILDLHKDAEISCTQCHGDIHTNMKASCDDCHADERYSESIVYNEVD